MKRMLSLMTVLAATTVVAVERQQLMPLIESAATNRGVAYAETLPPRPPGQEKAVANRESAYIETRNKIVEYGKDALPLLDKMAKDESLTWQQQLVVRICKERIERKKDIEDLVAIDWRKHPDWGFAVVELSRKMIEVISAHLKEVGLWYYYLEVEWKNTGEEELMGVESWSSLCAYAVKDSPERVWFLRVCDDLLETAPTLPLRRLNNILVCEGKPDTIDLREKYRSKFSVLTSPPASYRDRLKAREWAEILRLPVTEP